MTTEVFYTTKQIGERLGFPLTAKFIIETLGFEPAKREKAAYFWTRVQFLNICRRVEQMASGAAIKAMGERKQEAEAPATVDDDEL